MAEGEGETARKKIATTWQIIYVLLRVIKHF